MQHYSVCNKQLKLTTFEFFFKNIHRIKRVQSHMEHHTK